MIAAMLPLAVIASSEATMIDATYVGNGAYQTHRAGFSAALSWDSSASVTTYNLKLSEHNWTVNGEAMTTWCVQIFQGLTAGSTYQFDVVEAEMVPQAPPAPGPMGMTKANLLRDAAARWLEVDLPPDILCAEPGAPGAPHAPPSAWADAVNAFLAAAHRAHGLLLTACGLGDAD